MEIVEQPTDIVDWDCKVQTFGRTQFEGYNTNGLTPIVDEWTAAISGIDGGIGLQNLEPFAAIPHRTEDASGDGSFETPWTPHAEAPCNVPDHHQPQPTATRNPCRSVGDHGSAASEKIGFGHADGGVLNTGIRRLLSNSRFNDSTVLPSNRCTVSYALPVALR